LRISFAKLGLAQPRVQTNARLLRKVICGRRALRQLELGQINFVELELEITAPGKLDSVLERLGKILE
jgi:hypothetical protein